MNARGVILGDCFGSLGLPSMKVGSIDHAIMDPPFAEHVHESARKTPNRRRAKVVKRTLGYGHFTVERRRALLAECRRIVRRWTIAFCDVESVGAWRDDFEAAGLKYVRAIPWVKPNAQPNLHAQPGNACEMIVVAHAPGRMRWNRGGKARWYEFPIADRGASRLHPEQKPLELMAAIVEDFTDPGDLIVDPFAGSGSTLVAAAILGRRGVGWEAQKRYVAAANARIAAATGG